MTDFVQYHQTPHSRWRIRKKKPWFIVLGILVFIVISSGLYYRSALAALYTHAHKGKVEFEEAKNSLRQQKFADTSDHLRVSIEAFSDAHNAVGKLGGLKVIPLIGRQVKAVDNALQVGMQAGSALLTLVGVAEHVTAPLQRDASTNFASISVDEKRSILESIAEGQPEIQGAKAQMDLAIQYLNAIPKHGLVGPLAGAIKPLREQLPVIDNVLDKAIPAVQVLPGILGYPEKRSYLFLLQNNTELRPTGGFIGTYGSVTFSNAEITAFTTHNVYTLDNAARDKIDIAPPAPLHTYLSADKWFFRDSNWSPDFPTAAQEAIRFYDIETETKGAFDGVIAVTPTFISDLMKVTGNITIGSTKYTPENLVDVLEYSVEKGYAEQGVSDDARKEVIGKLAQELFQRLLTIPHDRWSDVWKTLVDNVSEKQVLMYLNDQSEESFVRELGWGGEMRQTDGDFLMIVDANLASLKTDPGVKRSIDYSVEPDGDKLKAILTMHYSNEGVFNWKSTRYRTFVRFYVPQGSSLVSATGFFTNDKLQNGKPTDPSVNDELGKTVFAGFTSIEPKESRDIILTYMLPNSLAERYRSGQYSLLIQKQPGTEAHGLSLDITAEKPIQSYSPAEQGSVDGKTAHFTTDLRQDRLFSTLFRQ